MQKVACPMTIVQMLKLIPIGSRTFRIVACRANPVTIPGSAIGRMTRNEMISRPKNLERETASAASVPSTRAMTVAPKAALIESQQGVANVRVVPRDAEPLRRVVLDRPRLRDVLVERVDRDHDEREVNEHQCRPRAEAEEDACCPGLGHAPQRFSNAPSRLAPQR